VFGDVDDLYRVAGGLGRFKSLFITLAAHLVGVPPIITDKLKTLVGNVLGDGGDEVAGSEPLEVAVDLLAHAGLVDDRAAGVVDLHLFDEERVADDLPAMLRLLAQASIALQAGVLGEALQVLALVRLHTPAAMHVEAGMHPAAKHLGTVGRQQPLGGRGSCVKAVSASYGKAKIDFDPDCDFDLDGKEFQQTTEPYG